MDTEEDPARPPLAWSGAYDTEGKPHGQGVLTYPPPPHALADDEKAEDAAAEQGACYAGELVHGVRQGRGRYTWPPGAPQAPGARPAAPGGAAAACACYEGGYAAGLREGQGTMTYPDGGRYEGEWAAGARAGFGTYWYPGRGDMYQGAWRAGRRHGQGSQHCAALEAQCIGDWADGRFLSGRLVLKDGGWLCLDAGQDVARCHYQSAEDMAQTGRLTADGWLPLTSVSAL